MTPYFVRNILYNAKVRRSQYIINKQKFAINKKKISSMPNRPEDPNNWIGMFIGGIASCYAIDHIIYKK